MTNPSKKTSQISILSFSIDSKNKISTFQNSIKKINIEKNIPHFFIKKFANIFTFITFVNLVNFIEYL